MAIDAAIAGALTCFVAEPLLASAGGAGILLVRQPGRDVVAVDFFSKVPGLGLTTAETGTLDFEAIEVDFGEARQSFHVGRGSATVPAVFEGLARAARELGTLPLAQLVAPAVAHARAGVVADALTARTFSLLWPILRRDPSCMAELAAGLPGDRPPQPGDRIRNPTLADTLEAFGDSGETPPAFIDGLLAEFGPERGGRITRADVEHADVVIGEPHRFTLGEWSVATSPRIGGLLVDRIATLAFTELASGGLIDEQDEAMIFAQASLAGHRARDRMNRHGSTTHVSVVDELGGAATVTLTAGEGCGHVVAGTGVHVNNFLGEEDLNPDGFHRHAPGTPLPTMIAPTIARHPDGRVLALGSGGSNRIRSAVAQVLVRLVREETIESAVAAPRVHAEDLPGGGSQVWVELGRRARPQAVSLALQQQFSLVHAFAGCDFFFGGVHTVGVDERGALRAAGDLRRTGTAVRVDEG